MAVRGHNDAIRFYELKVVKNEEGDLKGTSVKRIGKEFNNVGDFQNVHLLYDDRGDIYMFGMEQCPDELCYIYRIDTNDPEKMIKAVWIGDDGKIHDGVYSSTKNNKLEFELNHKAISHLSTGHRVYLLPGMIVKMLQCLRKCDITINRKKRLINIPI